MSDNPFLALFESSTSTNIETVTKPISRKASSNQTDSQVQINEFYERIFSFTINGSWDGKSGSVFSAVYLENLSLALTDQNYISKEIIGQAICERIFYDADDLRRLVRKRNSSHSSSTTEETRRVGKILPSFT